MRVITSRPKKLFWYHKIVIVCAAVGACAVAYLIYSLIATRASYDPTVLLYAVVALAGMCWFLYRDLVGVVVVKYDRATLYSLGARGDLNRPFPFTELRSAIRRSSAAVVLNSKTEENGFEVEHDGYISHTSEATIRGHDDDIESFCRILADAGVPVSDDGMGDDPPEKNAAIFFLVFIILGVIIVAMFAAVKLR